MNSHTVVHMETSALATKDHYETAAECWLTPFNRKEINGILESQTESNIPKGPELITDSNMSVLQVPLASQYVSLIPVSLAAPSSVIVNLSQNTPSISEQNQLFSEVAQPLAIVSETISQSSQANSEPFQVHNLTKAKPLSLTDNENNNRTEGYPILPIESKKHKKQYICKCGQGFAHKGSLSTHMRVHTGDKPFQCSICHKRFAHRQNQEFHMLRHTGEKPYKCDKCDLAFICVALLNRHKREHEGNYAFMCDICNQGFKLKRNYIEHMNVHTNTRPFSCNICDKSFSRREALRIHKKIHSGETPFTCKECGKSFAIRTRLELHIRRHTGETPYMCMDCGKTFYTSPQLNEHQRRYKGSCKDTGYKCEECGAVFKKACDLSDHSRTHQTPREKIQICHHCGYKCMTRRSLTIHLGFHDPTRPHHCPTCSLFFPTQNAYSKHKCTPSNNKGSEVPISSEVEDEKLIRKTTQKSSMNADKNDMTPRSEAIKCVPVVQEQVEMVQVECQTQGLKISKVFGSATKRTTRGTTQSKY